MATLIIQHPVANFQTWKKAFDSDPLGRARNGVVGHTVYRAADDPSHVVVMLEFSSAEKAQAFLPGLREMWGRVSAQLGLGGGPQARILDEVEQVHY